MRYTWTVTNASIWDTSSNNQFAYVNFNMPGTAVVTLTLSEDGTSCTNSDEFIVHVGDHPADPPTEVIYFKKSLIALQNVEDGYQWGYDDHATLLPVTLAGEINQNYYNPNPDFENRHYWVMIWHNGCVQKSYYNPPAPPVHKPESTEVSVFPNPANDNINVEVKTTVDGDIHVEVLDMLGRKIYETQTVSYKAKIDVAGMQPGAYMINCYRNGIRINTTRFVKN
jgi:hypothetical protein